MNKHEQLRKIIVKYGNHEYGDLIIDEICRLFNYPDTNCQHLNVNDNLISSCADCGLWDD